MSPCLPLPTLSLLPPYKSVYRITCVTNTQDDNECFMSPIAFNNKCYRLLKQQKDMITHYNHTKKWDKYKKFMNDHELIFTSSLGFPNISKHAPISRSFFKLWEILHDFKADFNPRVNDATAALTICCVAEGPGGFIEAFIQYRNDIVKAPVGIDNIYGMTLISQNKNVPNWKFTHEYQYQHNIKLCAGVDGTGSLYNIANIDFLANKVSPNSCDIVTADGGFDYSSYFNEQEEASLHLIMCEVYCASVIQRVGGCFVLKIFDISQPRMFQIIYYLYQSYKSVYFTKPFTSRPANSEKYIVCVGYHGCNPELQNALRNAITTEHLNDKSHTFIKVPLPFQKEVVYYNTHYTTNQILSIIKTLDFIEAYERNDNRIHDRSTIQRQLESALRWCYKYKLPINPTSLIFYKKNYLS